MSIERVIRSRLMVGHTATHLLQAVLKQLVEAAIARAGLLLNVDRLRLDFHRPPREAPERAWAAGAAAMFGDKYDALMRVVDRPTALEEVRAALG